MPQPYLLYGQNWGRKVTPVPEHATSSDGWCRVVMEMGLSVIAVGPLKYPWWSFGQEHACLNDPQGPFSLVYGRDMRKETLLYRLRL